MFESVSTFLKALVLILVVGACLYAGLARLFGFKYRKQLFGTRRINGQGTEIPLDGNLFAAYYVLNNQGVVFPEEHCNSLSAALFLRWIAEGKVQVKEPSPTDREQTLRFLFPENVTIGDPIEKQWYGYFLAAADEDRELLDRKLAYRAHYVESNAEKISKSDFEEAAKRWIEDHDYIKKVTPWNIHLNEAGQKDARRVVELENYLKAFSAGTPIAEPADDKLPYYLQLAVTIGKEKEFLQGLLEKYPARHSALAARLGVADAKLGPLVAHCRKMVEPLWNED